MDQKIDITKYIAEQSGLPTDPKSLKKWTAQWWCNPRRKLKGGLKLTDEGFARLTTQFKCHKVTLEEQIEFTLKKTRFFDRFKDKLNDRQLNVIKRMLEEGTKGFEGGMNARKYIGITKTSKATATRDMQQLLELGAFKLASKAGGRSTSYQVNL